MDIIAFTGSKRAGKTTAAQYFLDQGYTLVSFKSPILEEVIKNFPDLLMFFSRLYGMDVATLLVQKPAGVRELLQNYGTDLRRSEDPDYWVNAWHAKVNALGGKIVVDDIRFLNEAEAIKDFGGKIIRVTRDTGIEPDKHISEVEMSQIQVDAEIENNGTVEELYNKLEKL
jgi:hypothetical protein